MYVLRYRKYPGARATLTEITRAQFRKFEQTGLPEDLHYDPVDASYAHRWVRNGGHHETPLWVDRGRIRRASE